MSESSNRTILVPVSQSGNSLTNFKREESSYASFKHATVAKARLRSDMSDNLYDGTDNAILGLAASILKQINVLQNSYDIGSLEDVKQSMINDIEYFSDTTIKKGIDNAQAMLARYLLCTFSDEIISTTYWGKENNWANSSLLGHFYNETYGGDKFFQILEQLLHAPAKYLDLLELAYVCLSLGFEGKYKIQNRGQQELDSIRENLYRQMKMMKIRETKQFYSTQKVSTEHNHLVYKTSYQILALSMILMLSLVYIVLTFSLINKEDAFSSFLQTKHNKYARKIKTEIIVEPVSINAAKRKEEPKNKVPETTIIKGLNE